MGWKGGGELFENKWWTWTLECAKRSEMKSTQTSQNYSGTKPMATAVALNERKELLKKQ